MRSRWSAFSPSLGFGDPVTQLMLGSEVNLRTSMRMACSSVIAHELERIVPAGAYSEIQPTQGDTATFLLHQDFVNKVLKVSGQNSIFYKDKSTNKEFELLWLEAESSLTDACKLAEHGDVFGIPTKAKSGDARFAFRFQDIEAMKSFAKAHHLPDQPHNWITRRRNLFA